MEKNSNVGLGVIVAKVGGKLLPIVLQLKGMLLSLVKSAGSIKAAGLAASMVMYTYLFTWQMGLALIVFVGIHEYGHLWAMQRRGIRTRGMFFLPGFGAVAIAEDRFGSADNEVYIALMGPVFGLIGFVIPILLLYMRTGDPIWAAIASFTAFINLANLFPINPLDGGRVVKGLVYSNNPARSLGMSVALTVAGVGLAMGYGLYLFCYLAVIGFFEIAGDFGVRERLRHLLASLARIAVAVAVIFIMPHLLRFDFTSFLTALFLLGFFYLAGRDARRMARQSGARIWMYPMGVLICIYLGVKELLDLRKGHINPIENYAWMTGGQKMAGFSSYAILVLVHTIILGVLARIPEASIGRALMH